jgi:hypothetical protein
VLRSVSFAVACLLAGYSLVGCSNVPPQLGFDSSVPDDLQELAAEVWEQFLDHHPARIGCIGDVALHADWDLDTRGEYRPESATVVVRIPGTASTLGDELVHEFAHHVEFTCPEHVELREEFLRAQGFPSGADWFGGASWETTPSEQYAEATVQYVQGSRSQRQGIELTDDAVAAVRNWAGGSEEP